MRIVVLFKAVPPVGEERLDARFLTDRAALEPNGGDEYCLEAALRLTDVHGGEVTLLTMGPQEAAAAIRKALAMGASRAVLVSDRALAGACIVATGRVLAAALGRIEYDLVLAGASSSDAQGGLLGAALATRLHLPYVSHAAALELSVDGASLRVRQLNSGGIDTLETVLPALVMGTQLLGEPRYPTLRGTMQARSKAIAVWSLADLAIDPASVGLGAATTEVLGAAPPPPRGRAVVVRASPAAAAVQAVDFLAVRGLLA